MSAHTPGPWMWGPNYCGLTSKSGDDVLTFYEYDNMRFTLGLSKEADARVIAAAPEMLEALKSLLAVAPHTPPAADAIVGMRDLHEAAIQAARAAIAKAEGKA